MLSITPFLWFDTQAEEAMKFYTSIFPRSRVISVQRAGDAVMSVTWELEGQRFMGLNAGPHFTFNEAVSFFVACETQQEVDELSDKLLAHGGKPTQCGWLKDSSACRGRSSRTSCRSCSAIPTARKPAAPCRR